MIKLTSVSWWIETFVQTLICMVFIVMIRNIASQFNIPIIKDIAQEV